MRSFFSDTSSKTLLGVSLSEGKAVGILKKINEIPLDLIEETPSSQKEEKKKLLDAFLCAEQELLFLEKKMELERAEAGALLIFSEIEFLQDKSLKEEILKRISIQKESAKTALSAILQQYKEKFLNLKDPFFQEKFKDLEDVGKRILLHLQFQKPSLEKKREIPLSEKKEAIILLTEELSISMVAEADPEKIKGFISLKGSLTSHAAILARARGFPYMVVPYLKEELEGTLIALDTSTNSITLSPDTFFLNHFYSSSTTSKSTPSLATSSMYTTDNIPIHLSLNIDSLEEIANKEFLKPLPIGLFRSEYLLLKKEVFPNEEEQFFFYKKIAERASSSYSIIRTFDIGGDKNIIETPSFLSLAELKPFLNLRTLRFLLEEQSVFKTQLRAILRASAFGNLAILLPMISSYSELVEAKNILEKVKKELSEENKPFQDTIALGCMIELPSACMVADFFAKECDFLSIGTNDLIQYAFGIDRTTSQFSATNTHLEPGIFRLIQEILKKAFSAKEGIPITLCGEMANDLEAIPFLIGIGINRLSIPPYKLKEVQDKISKLSFKECQKLAKKALSLKTSHEIGQTLNLC